MNSNLLDSEFLSRVKEQRIACFAYAFFFAIPLLFQELKTPIFWCLFLVCLIFVLFGIFSPLRLTKVNAVLRVPLHLSHVAISQIFLVVLFFFVLSPTALILRLLGRNLLNLKIDNKCRSYWIRDRENRNWQQFFKDPF